MKRTVPLIITTLVGVILIASFFIPAAESWGEVAAIWFDILAAMAFVLGGLSLLKLYLAKISDRAPGWAYSVITLAAFLVTLVCGLTKVGSPPAIEQEFYGQSFVPLDIDDLPPLLTVSVPGELPTRGDGEHLPLSVAYQFSAGNGQLTFRGWMTEQQEEALSDFKDSLAWKCAIEQLFEKSQTPGLPRGMVKYLPDHGKLGVATAMPGNVRDALLALGGNDTWRKAVERLDEISRKPTTVPAELPDGYAIPAPLSAAVSYDPAKQELTTIGPMSASLRNRLARANFPIARRMTEPQRDEFRKQLDALGDPLNDAQATALDKLLQSAWTPEQLEIALNLGGVVPPVVPTACQLRDAQLSGKPIVPPPIVASTILNDRQRTVVNELAADASIPISAWAERLQAAGAVTDGQLAALAAFIAKQPTAGEQKLTIAVELLKQGPLSKAQRDMLVDEYRSQRRWRRSVGELFAGSHITQYPWSGQYNDPASAFGWLYEYAMKPLTSTMFALLAFFVASAAFRAFRAKNLAAIFLLGTAFIILLGRTFAGYLLTAWIPPDGPFAWLRVENLTMLIMSVFTLAGTRAIMIGIALGLVSTSLKVLLGIDRSYLGGGEG